MPATTTPEHQRERNRRKTAAYRARNVDKARAQTREAVRRLREKMKAEGRVYPKPEGRVYPKPEGRVYPKPEGRVYPKPEGRVYPKPEGRVYPKPEGRVYPKPEPASFALIRARLKALRGV
jgi:hypothetical protein